MSKVDRKVGNAGRLNKNSHVLKEDESRQPSGQTAVAATSSPQIDRLDHARRNHWWQIFTNDLGMFTLTFDTLVALVFYTLYTRQLVVDTETSYTTIQRAFVTPLPIQVDQTTIAGERAWMFTTIVENSGATPTKGMNFHQYKPCFHNENGGLTTNLDGQDIYCDFDVEHGHVIPNVPRDPAKGFGERGMVVGRYPLGPHAKVTIGKVTATQKQIAAGWYISGIIYYHDVFVGTTQHVTKYCYTVSLWPFDGPDTQPVFTPCEKWNCVDDECV